MNKQQKEIEIGNLLTTDVTAGKVKDKDTAGHHFCSMFIYVKFT